MTGAVQPSRRTLLKAGGLAVAATAVPLGAARAEPRPVQEVQLRGTAFGTGQYLYHPFTVPTGVNRLDVRIDKQGDAKTGLGIFDARGSHYATLERPNASAASTARSAASSSSARARHRRASSPARSPRGSGRSSSRSSRRPSRRRTSSPWG
jgi:hypothetical protein